jgi:serine/threonine protein kinase
MDEVGRGEIAASISAFLNCVKSLEAHYMDLSTSVLGNRAFPYQTHYQDETGQVIDFKYESRIPEKLVFFAKANQEELPSLCVKFVRRYSADAHLLLAEAGHAPKLRSFTSLPGGWHMVVMDASPFSLLSSISRKSCNIAVSTVQNAVGILHKHNFVHGDIRDCNILAHVDDKENAIIHIIDFDWAGKIGEARYPMRVNTKSVARPSGVGDGELITTHHDLQMIARLS